MRLDYQQGSPEWKEWRKTVITATDSAVIMGRNPYKTPIKLWRQKVGIDGDDFVNEAMMRGSRLEPKARKVFEDHTGLSLPDAVLQHDHFPWMAASLDGYDGTHLLEIKSPGERILNECRNGNIPIYWLIQMQHQLCVTGAEFVYLFVFDGENGEIHEIEKEPETIQEIIEETKEFYRRIKEFDPPEDKYKLRSDSEWVRQAHKYSEAKIALDRAKRVMELERNKLLSLAQGESVEGAGVRVCRFYSKGQVDYKEIPELKGVDLEKYRKPGSERVTVTFKPEVLF